MVDDSPSLDLFGDEPGGDKLEQKIVPIEDIKSPSQREEENKGAAVLDIIAEQDRALEHMGEIAEVLKAQAVEINNVIEVVEDAKDNIESAVVLELQLPQAEGGNQEESKNEEGKVQQEENKVEEVKEIKEEEKKEVDVKEEDQKEPEEGKQSPEVPVQEEQVVQEQPVSQIDQPIQEGTLFSSYILDQKDPEKVENKQEESVAQPDPIENPEVPKPAEPVHNVPAEPGQNESSEGMFKPEDVIPSEEDKQNVESEQDEKAANDGVNPKDDVPPLEGSAEPQAQEPAKEGENKEENKVEGEPKEEDQKQDEAKPVDANQNPVKEEDKEDDKKSESEYEDVEDPEFDVFNSDDSTEKKRIIPIEYRWGGKGFLRKECIKKKITIYVKTFYGSRTKHKYEVNINSKVGTLIGKPVIS